MTNPAELVNVLGKIQQGISFFTANYDYKKADQYLKKFTYLRSQALEKLNVKVLKILRDSNATSNLAIINSNVLETASNVSEIDINSLIFTMPAVESLQAL